MLKTFLSVQMKWKEPARSRSSGIYRKRRVIEYRTKKRERDRERHLESAFTITNAYMKVFVIRKIILYTTSNVRNSGLSKRRLRVEKRLPLKKKNRR